jgi:hypothetical protein
MRRPGYASITSPAWRAATSARSSGTRSIEELLDHPPDPLAALLQVADQPPLRRIEAVLVEGGRDREDRR